MVGNRSTRLRLGNFVAGPSVSFFKSLKLTATGHHKLGDTPPFGLPARSWKIRRSDDARRDVIKRTRTRPDDDHKGATTTIRVSLLISSVWAGLKSSLGALFPSIETYRDPGRSREDESTQRLIEVMEDGSQV